MKNRPSRGKEPDPFRLPRQSNFHEMRITQSLTRLRRRVTSNTDTPLTQIIDFQRPYIHQTLERRWTVSDDSNTLIIDYFLGLPEWEKRLLQIIAASLSAYNVADLVMRVFSDYRWRLPALYLESQHKKYLDWKGWRNAKTFLLV
jgi:hypothetical protein